jgi:hypothetical protein
MSHMCLNVGHAWPTTLHHYEYLRAATMPEWAWEYLRRNVEYQASARLGHRKGVVRRRLAAGPLLTRLRARHREAETWALACFR